MKKIGVISISVKGMELGDKIYNLSGKKVERLTISNLNKDGWVADFNKLTSLMKDVFHRYDGIILIMSAGIAVRVISPYINKKNIDPAVVVMDEKGKYIISLLSGHLGGANKLTKELAQLTGGHPVITTATDINSLNAVDALALKWKMDIEPIENIVFFNKALLHGHKYTFWADKDLQITDIDQEVKNFKEYSAGNNTWNVIISNKKCNNLIGSNNIFLRPRNIMLGVGCKKNFPSEKFRNVVEKFLNENDLSIKSLGALATIDIKKEEKAILDLAQLLKIPLFVYSKEELNSCYEKFPFLKKSQFVYRTVNTLGVCEPAALLAAQNHTLLINKTSIEGVTLAVAEIKVLSLAKEFCWFE
ncbi:MAG: cobalt-precorrin 5A hydrolase [Bacillota bacterium]